VTDKIVATLREIVDEHPEYYLDEIAEDLLIRTRIHLCIATIHRTLIEKIGYSLRVCYDSALQRDAKS